jgi:hypothetical protein
MLKTLAVLAIFLNGCAFMPVHSVNVSEELQKNPVRNIIVFSPQFPDKLPNSNEDIPRPESYREMLPENQAISKEHILMNLRKSAKTTLNLIFDFESKNLEIEKWAAAISKKLAKGITPLKVDSTDLNVEAVLLIGVVSYGYVDEQFMWRSIFSKPKRLGKPKWVHVCHLNVMLIRPRDGKILMTVEHKEKISSTERNPKFLEEVTQKTFAVIADAFPSPHP